MRINYKLDNENRIIGWSCIPFLENLPSIEIEKPEEIILNFDIIIDGKYFSKKDEFAAKKAIESRIKELIYQIDQLKEKLQETDYRLYKFIEGYYTAEEYEPYKIQRQTWRDEINRLEQILEALK